MTPSRWCSPSQGFILPSRPWSSYPLILLNVCMCGGVVWCGVVWCGVVWCGVVWCGVVWCGVVWCGVVWCGACILTNRQAGNQLVGRVHKQCSSHATTIFDLFSEELSLTDIFLVGPSLSALHIFLLSFFFFLILNRYSAAVADSIAVTYLWICFLLNDQSSSGILCLLHWSSIIIHFSLPPHTLLVLILWCSLMRPYKPSLWCARILRDMYLLIYRPSILYDVTTE